jgi:predicted phage terminase large subunit-like protein
VSELFTLAAADLACYAQAAHPGYQLGAHHLRLIENLEAVEAGAIKRLMIFMPPQHGKSATSSILFPTWAIGRKPTRSVIFATYNQDYADDFGRKVRNIVKSPLYGLIFPAARLAEDSASMSKFSTTAGGSFYAVGRGSAITGRGGDIVVVDDPLKDREEADSPTIRRNLQQWFSEVVYTRLRPDASIVLVQTRWHLNDLAGWLLTEHPHEDWRVLSLPALAEPGDPLGRAEGEALWPERYPVETLQRIRASMTASSFAALYEQRPVPAGGAIFQEAWLQGRFDPATLSDVEITVQSWDTAFGKSSSSGDYSACATIARGKHGFYILNVVKGRWPFPQLKAKMVDQAAQWNPSVVLVEDTAAGASALQELQAETALPIKGVKATTEKAIRFEAVSPLFESGRVFFPTGAAWLDEVLAELVTVPAAAHDDVTDAIAQGLAHFRARQPGENLLQFYEQHIVERGEDGALRLRESWLREAGADQTAAAADENAHADEPTKPNPDPSPTRADFERAGLLRRRW